MIIRIARSNNPGDGYVYLVESYRNAQGKPTNRIVEKLGLKSELEAKDPDALVKLRAWAKTLTAEKASGKGVLAYDTAEPSDGCLAQSSGWWLAEGVWDGLGLGDFYRKQQKTSGGHDLAEIVRLLTISRIVWPGSKKAAVERAGGLLFGPGPHLEEVYPALDEIARSALAMQAHVRASLGRERLDVVFYDVTNYFFDIDRGDDNPQGVKAARGEASRQRGYSKEGRKSPIIQMGLLLGPEGLPLAYRLFDGNVPDTSTLPAVLHELKTTFGAERVVVVADKALNTNPGAGALASGGDGWIFSASARKAAASTRGWFLDPHGWHWLDEGHTLKVKSRLISRRLPGAGPAGEDLVVSERQICRWSADYAARDRTNRAEMLAKAERLAADPAKWRASNRKGVKKYVAEQVVDPATGEVREPRQPHLGVDYARAEADALLDGYWLIHTSETATPVEDILARYHDLWRIEQSFRVSKTDLQARPVYVRTPAHIEAHFAICFQALLITRLLESMTGLSAAKIAEAMRHHQARHCAQGIYLLDRPDAWDAIDAATGVPLDQKWATISQLRQWRRELARATKDVLSLRG